MGHGCRSSGRANWFFVIIKEHMNIAYECQYRNHQGTSQSDNENRFKKAYKKMQNHKIPSAFSLRQLSIKNL